MSFPQSPLDLRAELKLSSWTNITSYNLQRDGTSPPVSITRGRQNESGPASPAKMATQWNNRDGRFSPRNPAGPYYGLLGRNTPLRYSVAAALNYLRVAEDQASGASCPSVAALQLVNADIDVRTDMVLDNWQACFLAGQWTSGAACWALTLNGDGTLRFTWFDGTFTNVAASTMPLPLGRVAARCWFDPLGLSGSAQVIFYTAPVMAGSFTQLGKAVPITASDFAHTPSNGFLVADAPFFGLPGFQGAIYEVQLYANAGGGLTLVADPVFSAQAAGTTSFTDSRTNAWTLSGTAEISSRSYLAHVECTTLPQRWDASGTDVWTPVEASGILRRIGQGSSPVPSVMRRAVPAQPSSAKIIAYWPGEDLQGSTQIASGLPGGTPMMVTGTPAFQGTAGSLSSDSQFTCSAQLAQPASSTWTGFIPAPPSASCTGIFFLLYVPSGTTSGVTLASFNVAGASPLTLAYTTAASGTLSLGGGLATLTGVTGLPLLVMVTAQSPGSGGQVTLTMLQAGQPLASQVASAGSPAVSSGQITSVIVNPAGSNLGQVELGHVFAVLNGSLLAADSDVIPSPLDQWAAAWAGETAAARFLRLCGENAIPARVYGYPDLTAPMGPQPVDTLSNLLQYTEDTDRGQLYEPAEAPGLGYRTLGSMCGQVPAVTLDYSLAQIGDGSAPLEPEDDDQFTVNDAIVQRNLGSSAQVQVTTGTMSISAPPAGVGDYSTQVTVYAAYDAQLPGIGGWITWVGTCDEERYPVIPLSLARTALAPLTTAVTAVRIGDYAKIVNLPAWMPPGPARQMVYGITHSLGGFRWDVQWNAVPEAPYEVAVYGTFHYGTAGSQLTSGVTSAATSLPVTTTAGNLWTTSAADFPFQVMIGGEECTVADINGPAANFLTGANASFEGGLGNWAAGLICTVASSAAQAHSGADSMAMTATGAGTMTAVSCLAGNVTTQGLACTPGDTVNGAKWFRAATAARSCLLQVGFYTSGGVIISTASGTAVADSTTGWVKAVISATAPATSAWCRLIDSVAAVAGAGEIHYGDDAYFANATSGGSAQTFVVIRSVNGVVKAQASGTAVNVYTPPVYGLEGNH